MYKSFRNKYEPVKFSPLVQVNGKVDEDTVKIIRDKAQELMLPMNFLIAVAIDNELDSVQPFRYPCDLPTTFFTEGEYIEEAKLIYNYLEKFEIGTDVETLMLSRRAIGIESREKFLYGLRELLATSLVEEFKPSKTMTEYHKDYRRIRVVKTDPRTLKEPKHKRIT